MGNRSIYFVYFMLFVILISILYSSYKDDQKKKAENQVQTESSVAVVVSKTETPKTSWQEIKKFINRNFKDDDIEFVEIDWQEQDGPKYLSLLLNGHQIRINMHLGENAVQVYDANNYFRGDESSCRNWAKIKVRALLAEGVFDDFPDIKVKEIAIKRLKILTGEG